jgi:nucleotide-binding universal stress UspA family protein
MKILLAIDGSPHSNAAVEEVARRPWPERSQIKILAVIHAAVPEMPDPFFFMYAAHEEQLEEARRLAPEIVANASRRIRKNSCFAEVETEVLEGSPKKAIIEAAGQWEADLIIVGSHGYGPAGRFLLGSVSHAVALHSPCSVEIVRAREPSPKS